MNFYDPIGFFYTCYKENRAVEYSIKRLRRVYPDAPIYLVSEGTDFSYLEEDYDEISTHLEEDTMSPTFHITGDYWQGNFRERNNQEAIHKCAWATLTRLEKAIDYCKTEYMVMCDPDVLVREEKFKCKEYNSYNGPSHMYYPKTNDFIMFPAHIEHWVDPNWSDTPRIALAFNVKITYENEGYHG